MSGHDIFISYSREERATARMYAESFAAEGLKVWWDAALHSGETFDEVIERELRSAMAVVVLWSPRSVASRWVRAEATLADRNDKLVPVIIEPCNRPIIFELTHAADLSDWTGDRSDPRWGQLVADIRRHAKAPVAESPAAEAPPEKPAPAEAPAQDLAPEQQAERKAAAPAEPASPEPKVEAKATPAPSSHDDLIEALERLKLAPGSVQLEPARYEDTHTSFFKRADAFRLQEGDEVHCLRRQHEDGPAACHVITPGGIKIGRTKPADVIVAEPGVSRQHCVIELAADKVRVTDLNSTNGTYIDNKRIARPEILKVGSVLRVGNISFEHELRPRSELQQQDDADGFNVAAPPQPARIARPS